jgi:hypothetical protein
MNNEKLNGNMNMMEMIFTMSEGNPGAMRVVMEMMKDPRSFMDILLLDSLDIRGSKIWLVYNDCCNQDMNKYNRTLMALRCGAFSEKEIQENLELGRTSRSIPFLDDSVKIEGVPSYEEHFGPTDEKWDEYIEANRAIFVPRLKKATGKDISNPAL